MGSIVYITQAAKYSRISPSSLPACVGDQGETLAECWVKYSHTISSLCCVLSLPYRFWNTTTGCALEKIDTGSQVCNLSWSRNVNEIVSTHGYSQNQVVVWKYPTMTKLVTLTGRHCLFSTPHGFYWLEQCAFSQSVTKWAGRA